MDPEEPIRKPLPPRLFRDYGENAEMPHNELGYDYNAVVAHPVTVF